jgi:hypothetical protein
MTPAGLSSTTGTERVSVGSWKDPGHGNGHSNGPKYTPETPAPNRGAGCASQPEKARPMASTTRSKKHVAGEKGTPFSQCVTAMAKAANNEKTTPSKSCKGMSRKHVVAP